MALARAGFDPEADSDAAEAYLDFTRAGDAPTLRSADRGFLVITHYQRLLDYIVPDVVQIGRAHV